jgi:hypothetical protein
MATFAVTHIPYGWRLELGDLTVDAENPHFDRGAIRARLTVRNCTVIHFLDTANLTSERSRKRLIQKLAEQNVTLDERVLIALDETCRTPPRAKGPENVCRDAGTHTSETVTEFGALLGVVTVWLLLHDPDMLPIILGALAANRFGGTPV